MAKETLEDILEEIAEEFLEFPSLRKDWVKRTKRRIEIATLRKGLRYDTSVSSTTAKGGKV